MEDIYRLHDSVFTVLCSCSVLCVVGEGISSSCIRVVETPSAISGLNEVKEEEEELDLERGFLTL